MIPARIADDMAMGGIAGGTFGLYEFGQTGGQSPGECLPDGERP